MTLSQIKSVYCCKKFDLVHQTISPCEREGSEDEATGYHALSITYVKECMPMYVKGPKVTFTFIRRSKIVV